MRTVLLQSVADALSLVLAIILYVRTIKKLAVQSENKAMPTT